MEIPLLILRLERILVKMSLIHRYKSNGFNIVLDINSGCIHLVDDVTYEVLPFLEEGLSSDDIVEKL